MNSNDEDELLDYLRLDSNDLMIKINQEFKSDGKSRQPILAKEETFDDKWRLSRVIIT